MPDTMVYSGTLTIIKCGECGIPHAVPTEMEERNLNRGTYWYCPNGHYIHYCETENKRLQNRLAKEQQRREQAEAEINWQRNHRQKTERRLSATQGVVTRTKNRIKNGICPCCRRNFVNLGRHMKHIHLDYGKKE